MLAIRKHHNLYNAVLCEDRFAKTDALYAHTQTHTQFVVEHTKCCELYVLDEYTLDDCHPLEKGVNITYVYEHKDVTVSGMFIIIALNRKWSV